MTAKRDRIARVVNKILREEGVSEPPVPIARIARDQGARVKYHPFAGELSGMLARDGDTWIIGVNSLEAPVRQRFTIAHELGHMLLDHLSSEEEVHIDAAPVRFRDPKSGEGTDPHEVEANRFAAELLMPRALLLRDIQEGQKAHGSDAEQLIDWLAARFRVSRHAMTLRLTNLQLIS